MCYDHAINGGRDCSEPIRRSAGHSAPNFTTKVDSRSMSVRSDAACRFLSSAAVTQHTTDDVEEPTICPTEKEGGGTQPTKQSVSGMPVTDRFASHVASAWRQHGRTDRSTSRGDKVAATDRSHASDALGPGNTGLSFRGSIQFATQTQGEDR